MTLGTQEGAIAGGIATPFSLRAGASHGPVIGRYHLLQKIGEGGMGEVWLAEQREPVRRRVAVKLVKAGMNSREVMGRFESERQALALMDHPAIAKVLDAGSSADGIPYFVMEYVAGVPVTDYCDKHKLSTRERLELFLLICDGVQHAHQKAIIHRDLKPSNVLVTEVDGHPAPKIIDFGVAKALTQGLTSGATLFTRIGTLIGTPQYMSPEQANSSAEDVDTRTDVYSLGIIFYELLAGTPPLDFKRTALHEFLKRVQDEEPVSPSSRIDTQSRDQSTELAHKRRTEPQVLVRQVRGDLDAIALKAIEKERARRYGSPSEFAADIRRYLNNETVLAVPPSAAYRARKFARRHRVPLATAAAFIAVLIATSVISVQQRIRANREAAVSKAVSDFLRFDLLGQASSMAQSTPGQRVDPDLKVRTALDRATATIQSRFEHQPEVEAAIRETLGVTYIELGEYAKALPNLQRSFELYRKLNGPDDPVTLNAANSLGIAQLEVGKYAEAEQVLSRTLQAERHVIGPENPDTLMTMTNLSLVYQGLGKHAEAEKLDEELLELKRRVRGPEHIATLRTMISLAGNYQDDGNFARAETLYSQALEIQRRVLGAEHPETLRTVNILADLEADQGKYAQAETQLLELLPIRRRVMGPEHPGTMMNMTSLARVYSEEGKFAQAEALHMEILELKRRVMGPEHQITINSLEFIADMYQRAGKYPLAEKYGSEAYGLRRKTLGANSPFTMNLAAKLAMAYVSQGKFESAEPLMREAQQWDKAKRPDSWERWTSASLLGASLAGEKKYGEAEPLLLQAYQGMSARKDKTPIADRDQMNRTAGWLASLYGSWGKADKAVEWKQKSS